MTEVNQTTINTNKRKYTSNLKDKFQHKKLKENTGDMFIYQKDKFQHKNLKENTEDRIIYQNNKSQIQLSNRNIVSKATKNLSNEIRFAEMNLDHDHIVKYIEWSVNSIKMPYYSANNLGRIILDNKLWLQNNPSIGDSLFYQLCQAIKFLRSNKIAHCDLKPENIMFCAGSLKLIDFDLFSVFADYNDVNYVYSRGTTNYRPLKLLFGEKVNISKVDSYGLGIIYFMLHFGHLPMLEKNLIQDSNLFERNKIWEKMEIYIKSHENPYFTHNEDSVNLIKQLIKNNEEERLTVDEIFDSGFFKKKEILKPIQIHISWLYHKSSLNIK